MYTRFQLAKKYLGYYITSSNGKGHGVHSPFVFDFIKFVLNDRKSYDAYKIMEEARAVLLADPRMIDVEDFGAGSAVINTKKRKVSAIAASSLKPKKYSRLLFRMIQYYHAQQVLELGTSFGITTAYMASASNGASITTMEGSVEIAKTAQLNFDRLQLKNIQLMRGDFEHTLPAFLSSAPKQDLVFIDGNHRKEPTLRYFQSLLPYAKESTIMVFDDIHWSRDMEEAWEILKTNAAVTLSIDLFFIGILFFRKDFKVKQHFTIRF